MSTPIHIDFVSDVSCPWCAIGLWSLNQALAQLDGQVEVTLLFQPFELNPDMLAQGQEINEHLSQKYGASPEQLAQTREQIRQRGAALGFEFGVGKRDRIYNTFDAHRLLHWAGHEGPAGAQKALKMALFAAYFTYGRNPGAHEVLLDCAHQAALDVARAAQVLDEGLYAAQVRERQTYYASQGIHSVPAVILNGQHLISGGQAPEVFEQAIRQLAGLA